MPPAFVLGADLTASTTIDDRAGLDRAGVAISALCLVHCLALPLIAAALPAVDAWVDPSTHHRVHWGLLAVALPISLAALASGARRHRMHRWLALGVVGLALMLLAVLGWLGVDNEVPITIVGVTLLAAAHVGNWRARHRAAVQHAH